MPDYKIRDPKSGRTITLRGDSPPTEAELEDIFAQADTNLSNAAQDVTPTTTMRPAEKSKTWGEWATDILPSVGGTIGGIAAGPVGAGVGGAAGQGFKTTIKNLGELPGAVKDVFSNLYNEELAYAKDLTQGKVKPRQSPTLEGFAQGAREGAGVAGTEGAVQGALDVVGGAVAKHVLAPVARTLTKHAFRPAAKALDLNPNLIQDILNKSIALSEKGMQKAKGFVDRARRVTDSMVDDLEAKPNTWFNHPQTGTFGSKRASVQGEIIDPVFNSTQSIKDPNLPNAVGTVEQLLEKTPGRKTLERTARNIAADNPAEVGPKRLLEIKRAEGKAAGELWNQAGPKQALKGKIHGDLHNAADAALERRLGPAWKEGNAQTQRNLVTLKTVEDALHGSKADSHMLTPFDQFLMMRGIALGDPMSAGIALAREAGRFRRGVAAAGRVVNQAGNKRVPQEGLRYGRYATGEDEELETLKKQDRAKRLSKASVDTLYNEYLKR